MKRLTIYCDMDGVLADFNSQPRAVKRFIKERGFFKNLEPMTENTKGLEKLYNMGYNIKILTTSPHKRADKDKMKWLKKYVPYIPKKDIIFARPNVPKIDYIDNENYAVLIDDYQKNIREWVAGGGRLAIKITPEPRLIEREYTSITMFTNYLKGL